MPKKFYIIDTMCQIHKTICAVIYANSSIVPIILAEVLSIEAQSNRKKFYNIYTSGLYYKNIVTIVSEVCTLNVPHSLSLVSDAPNLRSEYVYNTGHRRQ
jgi:hypothetical protein